MLSKSESNYSQISAHTAFEDATAKKDALSDNSLKQSIKTGTCALIHFFDNVFSFFHSFDLQLLPSFGLDEISPASPALVAWCSGRNNKINIVDFEARQEFSEFN